MLATSMRRILFAIIIILSIAFVLGASLFRLLAASTPPPDATLTPTQTPPSAPTATSATSEDVVALVNGQVIDQDDLRTARRAYAAMAALQEQPLPTAEWLALLVNGELVWQAAQAAEFTLPSSEIEQSLAALLAQHGRSRTDLESALAAQGGTLAEFTTYYGRLLLIDQFAAAQSEARGVPSAQYIAKLQQAAQISFGPAAPLAAAQEPTPTTAVADISSHPPPDPTLPAATAVSPTTDPLPTPSSASTQRYGVGSGQLPPPFDLPALNAAADQLALADLANQPAVLSFWTTWCPYCRAQTPALVAAHQNYASQGVQFVGINVAEERAIVQNYVHEQQIPYPILLDTDSAVANAYEITGFPTTYFLDRNGRIAARHVGQLSPEQLDQYLQTLLTAVDQ